MGMTIDSREGLLNQLWKGRGQMTNKHFPHTLSEDGVPSVHSNQTVSHTLKSSHTRTKETKR